MSEPGNRGTITAAIAAGVLDEELAALVWLLADGRVPLVVAGLAGSGASELHAAFAGLRKAGGGPQDADLQQRTVEADSLEDVLGPAPAGEGGHIPDQLRGLGTVLVLRALPVVGRRLTSAHYLRPVERDGAGHLQRRPPALLAAWDEANDQFDHFWWGITPELADRTATTVADFEAAHRARAGLLKELSDAGMLDSADLERAIRGLQLANSATGAHEGH